MGKRGLMFFSYGMGVDSTAILLRWIHEPKSRDFPLEDLVVLSAMTGDEWPQTGRMVRSLVLPLMRAHHIRYIQVARAGPRQSDGVRVLDDSRSPTRLFIEGDYTLSDEMLAAGTVPQCGDSRKCSAKAKGWLQRRGEHLPATEAFYVIAPHVVADKERPGFAAAWEKAITTPPASQVVLQVDAELHARLGLVLQLTGQTLAGAAAEALEDWIRTTLSDPDVLAEALARLDQEERLLQARRDALQAVPS